MNARSDLYFMKETVWKPLYDLAPYEVSDSGLVRNGETGTIICPKFSSSGRKMVGILGRTLCIDSLVAVAFFGVDPNDYDILHINDDLGDSRECNLRLIPKDRKRIFESTTGRVFESVNECAEWFGIAPGGIYLCLGGHRKQCYGYQFEYI